MKRWEKSWSNAAGMRKAVFENATIVQISSYVRATDVRRKAMVLTADWSTSNLVRESEPHNYHANMAYAHVPAGHIHTQL